MMLHWKLHSWVILVLILGAMSVLFACENTVRVEYKSPFIEACDSQLASTEKHVHPVHGYSVMVPDSWFLSITDPDSMSLGRHDSFVSGLTLIGNKARFDSLDRFTSLYALAITHYTGREKDLMSQYAYEMKGEFWNNEQIQFLDTGQLDRDGTQFIWSSYEEVNDMGSYHGIFFLAQKSEHNEFLILELGFYGEEYWEEALCRMQPLLNSFKF